MTRAQFDEEYQRHIKALDEIDAKAQFQLSIAEFYNKQADKLVEIDINTMTHEEKCEELKRTIALMNKVALEKKIGEETFRKLKVEQLGIIKRIEELDQMEEKGLIKDDNENK